MFSAGREWGLLSQVIILLFKCTEVILYNPLITVLVFVILLIVSYKWHKQVTERSIDLALLLITTVLLFFIPINGY